MRPITAAATVALTLVSLSACKIVKTTAGPAEGTPAATQAVEADQIQTLVDATFADKLVPLITGNALPLADLRSAVTADIDAAGAAHGNRGAGEGAAWNFAISGEGVVVSANLKSRARKAELDTTGDGAADVTLLLGPVIAGTSLRDVAPFYSFGDFRDQIEFAQLARALNDKLSPTLVLPDGDLVGKNLSFTGVVPLKAATDPFVVTTVTVKVDR
jgi:predicted lipoprotein